MFHLGNHFRWGICSAETEGDVPSACGLDWGLFHTSKPRPLAVPLNAVVFALCFAGVASSPSRLTIRAWGHFRVVAPQGKATDGTQLLLKLRGFTGINGVVAGVVGAGGNSR